MPVTDLLLEGLRLMVIGMGIVFAFLLLLVAVLRQMSKLAMRLSPDVPAPAISAPRTVARDVGRTADDELIAVISTAVARYRKDHRRT